MKNVNNFQIAKIQPQGVAQHLLKFLPSLAWCCRSSPPEVFLRKGVLRICSQFTGEHQCRSVISISCFATLLKSHFGMGIIL